MALKENCDKWMEFAYSNWLFWLRNEKGKTYLRESTRNLITRVKSASSIPGRNEEAWNLLQRLKRLSENFNNLDDPSKTDGFNLEYPEIYLECAIASYHMGDPYEAQELLRVSIARFPNRSLHKAISLWLYGCIQWQLPSRLEDALLSWEQSLRIVKDAELDNRYDQDIRNWCKNVEKAMILAINEGSMSNSPPPPIVSDNVTAESPSPSNTDNLNAELDCLGIFPVYEHIRAGDFGSSAILAESVGDLEIDRVFINGHPHRIKNINGDRVSKLSPMQRSVVIKVSGNSMDLANIIDGDHVLLQLLPKDISDFDLIMHPEDYGFYLDTDNSQVVKDGDIVAAEITDEDNKITLKRIFRRGKKIILEPDSTNPAHVPREFDKMNQGFFVCGVVTAIFKPI